MRKFNPGDKVKHGEEIKTIKVARKNFATQTIIYHFEEGGPEVEEKDLKKVALTKAEKNVQKKAEAKAKLLKLAEERKVILMPFKEVLKERELPIDLANISEEKLLSLAELSEGSFSDMIEGLKERLNPSNPMNEEGKHPTKMTRKSKKVKK